MSSTHPGDQATIGDHHPPSRPPLKILSLDGGGIKGYTSLLILQRVFRQMSTLREDGTIPKPCDLFDLIVGTSTGGLIATMLGRLGLSIEECLAYYEKIGKEVFKNRLVKGSMVKLVKGMSNSAFYDIRKLQTCIKNVLREKNIAQDAKFCTEQPDTSKV